MRVKCPRCGYEWDTKAKLGYIICPNCRKTFKKHSKSEKIEQEVQ
jgi:uncharacterized Zn finger protein (UPF0148 family)